MKFFQRVLTATIMAAALQAATADGAEFAASSDSDVDLMALLAAPLAVPAADPGFAQCAATAGPGFAQLAQLAPQAAALPKRQRWRKKQQPLRVAKSRKSRALGKVKLPGPHLAWRARRVRGKGGGGLGGLFGEGLGGLWGWGGGRFGGSGGGAWGVGESCLGKG